jgi:hypothetical protein
MNVLIKAYIRNGNKRPKFIGIFANIAEVAIAADTVAPPSFPPNQIGTFGTKGLGGHNGRYSRS